MTHTQSWPSVPRRRQKELFSRESERESHEMLKKGLAAWLAVRCIGRRSRATVPAPVGQTEELSMQPVNLILNLVDFLDLADRWRCGRSDGLAQFRRHGRLRKPRRGR